MIFLHGVCQEASTDDEISEGVEAMNFEELNGLFDKIGSFDFSKMTIPEHSFPRIEVPAIEAMAIDPEDTIIGDIKRKIEAQNELVSQQVGILLEQNKLLSDNYNKLKDMYDAQAESYVEAKEDLRKSRVFNGWMMVIAVVAMFAAIAGPIATVLVSR